MKSFLRSATRGVAAFVLLLILFPAPAYPYTHHDSKIKWQEYSPEAFSKAKKENKPIFMLISAVWCYWCHVFEDKTLEQDEVAGYVNEHYIPVFVDYEKRKDIARQYPASGLPATVILAPNGEELATVPGYQPPEKFIANLKRAERYIAQEFEPNVSEPIRHRKRGIVTPRKHDLASYIKGFLELSTSAYDSVYGGFGRGQKKPFAGEFLRILEYSKERNDRKLLDMVTKTLDYMAGFGQQIPFKKRPLDFEGLKRLRDRERLDIHSVARLQDDDVIVGIYDDIDGGFFRYATRRDWTVPHYEKMLSDNASLILLFLKAYEITGKDRYREVAEKSLDYVISTLYDDSDGRFYGSQDADEVYYHFTAEERRKVDPPRVDKNSYVPSNAMMVITLLNASKILKRQDLLDTAVRVLDFISRELVTDYGVLSYYDYQDQKGYINGNIEPNAWAALAFIEGYRFTKKEPYLRTAGRIIDFALENLYDTEEGGFFERRSTSSGFYREDELFLSEKPQEENGVMAYALYLAYGETGRKEFLRRARETFGHFAGVEPPVSAYFHRLASRLLGEKWL